MKFELLKRRIEINWKHVQVYLIVLFAVGLFSIAINSIFDILAGGSLSPITPYRILNDMNTMLMRYLGIFWPSVFAFGILIIAGAFGFKKDIQLCRSMAFMSFVFLGPIYFVAMTFSLGVPSLSMFSDEIAMFLSYSFEAFMLYLWLLFFIKPSMADAKNALKIGAVYAILLLLLVEAINFLIDYPTAYVPNWEPLELIYSLGSFLIFGFIVVYHMQDKKLDSAAYLFVGLYLGQFLLWASSQFILGDISRAFMWSIVFVKAGIGLGILYFLAKSKL